VLADEDAARQSGAEGEEVVQGRQVGAAQDPYLRAAAGPDDEVRLAVSVEVIRATRTPPWEAAPSAKKLFSRARSVPRKTLTCGPAPRPRRR